MSFRTLPMIIAIGIFALGCSKPEKKDAPKEAPTSSKVADKKPAPPEPKAEPVVTGDIIDVAVGAGTFKTLAAALKAAGLVEALKGDGPFTVFAPTDEAFAKLPKGTVEALLKDKEKLTAILTYHVVAGKVMAADVVKLTEASTLGGKKLTIDATDGVKVGAAKVIKADIAAKNGVIHVIDTVLIPE